MRPINKAIRKVDQFQRKNHFFSFIYAVIKKYGQDNGGYQSAILTYYAVLSLFPLLIVFTTITELALRSNSTAKQHITSALNHYFPIIGNQLQGSVHSPRKAGIALVLSLLVTLYGARGGASALQFSLNSLWHIPPTKQPPFLKNMSRGFGIILTAAVGFVVASTLSGYTAILGRSLDIRVLSAVISMAVLWATFIMLSRLAITGNKSVKSVAVGAGFVTIGIQVLQTLGGTILAHELKSLSNMSDTFALVIALMFWIYLQAEIILIGVEIDVVRAYHLYPRSIQLPLTNADKTAYTKYVEGQKLTAGESVRVAFENERITK